MRCSKPLLAFRTLKKIFVHSSETNRPSNPEEAAWVVSSAAACRRQTSPQQAAPPRVRDRYIPDHAVERVAQGFHGPDGCDVLAVYNAHACAPSCVCVGTRSTRAAATREWL